MSKKGNGRTPTKANKLAVINVCAKITDVTPEPSNAIGKCKAKVIRPAVWPAEPILQPTVMSVLRLPLDDLLNTFESGIIRMAMKATDGTLPAMAECLQCSPWALKTILRTRHEELYRELREMWGVFGEQVGEVDYV